MTIAISGWLSQETDVSQQWADLVDYFKDSNSSLFAYQWESKKAWSLADDMKDHTINTSKRHIKGTTMRLASKSHKLT